MVNEEKQMRTIIFVMLGIAIILLITGGILEVKSFLDRKETKNKNKINAPIEYITIEDNKIYLTNSISDIVNQLQGFATDIKYTKTKILGIGVDDNEKTYYGIDNFITNNKDKIQKDSTIYYEISFSVNSNEYIFIIQYSTYLRKDGKQEYYIRDLPINEVTLISPSSGIGLMTHMIGKNEDIKFFSKNKSFDFSQGISSNEFISYLNNYDGYLSTHPHSVSFTFYFDKNYMKSNDRTGYSATFSSGDLIDVFIFSFSE